MSRPSSLLPVDSERIAKIPRVGIISQLVRRFNEQTLNWFLNLLERL